MTFKGFWLGKNFVTIGQWKVMGLDVRSQIEGDRDDTLMIWADEAGGARFMRWSRTADPGTYLANEGDNLPMYFTYWNDAMEFAGKLNERRSRGGEAACGYEYTYDGGAVGICVPGGDYECHLRWSE